MPYPDTQLNVNFCSQEIALSKRKVIVSRFELRQPYGPEQPVGTNQLQRSRFGAVSGPAFLFQILVAVSQGWYTVLRGEIHKDRKRRLTQLGSTFQRDLILAMELERQQSSGFQGKVLPLRIRRPQKGRRQLYAHAFHASKLQGLCPLVMRFS